MHTVCVATRVALLGLLVAVCATATSAQLASDTPPCEQDDIPLQMLDGGHLKLTWHHLSFVESRQQGGLGLLNETGRTMIKVLVVVSYLDSDGKPIFAIPYFGGPDDSQTDIQEIRPYIKTIFNQAVKPGEAFMLTGANLESTRQVPAAAEVTLVDTEFDDESNSVSFSSTQATDPLLLKVPDFFKLSADPSKLPDELLITIAVDERGHVVDVSFDPSFAHSDDAESQIRSQLKLWSFFPATTNGYAVQAHLNLLFHFHERGFPLPRPTCPLDLSDKYPRTFVKVDLRSQGDNRWLAMYGGLYAHGDFSTIVSVTLQDTTADDSSAP